MDFEAPIIRISGFWEEYIVLSRVHSDLKTEEACFFASLIGFS
jgi:hypothetical protein